MDTSALASRQPIDVAHAGLHEDLGHGDAGGADAGDEHAQVLELAARRACSALSSAASTTTAVPCWSSWKTGMSSSRLQPVLDLEAARRGDVLEVDAAEARRDRLDGLDDLVDVLGVQADREGVDAGELLEEHRLALHDRHGRLRADVAEAEHGGAVGDDGDRVALDRVLEGLVAVLGDRHADARDAGRVGHREVVAGLERLLVVLLDLAAEVQQEGAVGGVDDPHAVESSIAA